MIIITLFFINVDIRSFRHRGGDIMAQVEKYNAVMNTRIRFIFRDKMESVRKSIQKCFRLYYTTIKTTVEVTDDYPHDPVIPITFNLG